MKELFPEIKIGKPTVSRALIKEWAEFIDTDPHKCTEASLVSILITVGAKIKEKGEINERKGRTKNAKGILDAPRL